MRSVSEVLRAVKRGELSPAKAEKLLKLDAIAVVDKIARIDYNRHMRRGIPEIVYARSKSLRQLASIVRLLAPRLNQSSNSLPIILSKLRNDQSALLVRLLRRNRKLKVKIFNNAGIIAVISNKHVKLAGQGKIALLGAGTSDIPALNEAEVILNLLGCRTIRFNDVGVAALHRLAHPLKEISKFDPDAIIVAAGMEGALPSVIAGLSPVPVIGLPTSVGYGYGGDGEAALMSMLQACSLGVSVVNIDAGVAAGVIAWLIAKRKQ